MGADFEEQICMYENEEESGKIEDAFVLDIQE